MSDIDRTIDKLVSALAASGIAVCGIDAAPWVDAIEASLPKGLPCSYQSLLRRYSFLTFDLGGVTLFGNTGEDDDSELATHVSPRKGSLQEVLLPAGYVQVGRPDTGNFDAICFDTNVWANNREYPVVRIDHEEILCNWRIKVVGQVWPSFFAMVEEFNSKREGGLD